MDAPRRTVACRQFVFMTWLLPLTRRAKVAPLNLDDVPAIGAGVCGWHSSFRKSWSEQKARRNGRPSVIKALSAVFWPTFTVVAVLKLVASALQFVPPLLLKAITEVCALLPQLRLECASNSSC